MRNVVLHRLLETYTVDASSRLVAAMAAGAELPYELRSEPAIGGPVFYSYKPLTGEFIDSNRELLAQLSSHEPAVRALSECEALDVYLAQRGGDERRPSRPATDRDRRGPPGAGLGADPGDRPQRVAAALEQPQRAQHAPEATAGDRHWRLIGPPRIHGHQRQHVGLAGVRPDRLRRRVGQRVAADQRDTVAERQLGRAGIERDTLDGRDHGR